MKKIGANLCLLLASCLAGLSLCELSLRLFYPKYRHQAEAQFRFDAMRIWARLPNSRDWRTSPDTLQPHLFHHNNLGLRQHRNFTETDLTSATNIGFFGDSFVENVRMAAHYSFTEPLDYLLNQGKKSFNVLNFGVDGNGPGQSFLSYQHFRHVEDLDHVFFVYCRNDLRDLFNHGLFSLDTAGRLRQTEAGQSSWRVRFISRLHLSYLILDVKDRLPSLIAETAANNEYPRRGNDESNRNERYLAMWRAGWQGRQDNDDLKNTLTIFRQLIRRWKHMVEQNGGTFSVVLLPLDPTRRSSVVDLLNAEDVDVIDLYACFRDADPAHRRWHRSPYRFKNDFHWNEAGNKIAAVCLYRFLEERVGLAALSKNELRAALSRYYMAFEGWQHQTLSGGEGSADVTGIREKYQALSGMDTFIDAFKMKVKKLTTNPERRIIRADFDVYLAGKDLIYVRDVCRPADTPSAFFLHITPVGEVDFPPHLTRGGAHTYHRYRDQQSYNAPLSIGEQSCALRYRLPDYSISHIHTGQYFRNSERPLWQGEVLLDQGALRNRLEEVLATPENQVLHSAFNVFLDGKWILYVTEVCLPADTPAIFFLHITPVDEKDLPEDRVEHGFDNKDFYAVGFTLDEERCVVRRRLPDYPIRHIRTGQYVPDKSRLWEGEFFIDQRPFEHD